MKSIIIISSLMAVPLLTSCNKDKEHPTILITAPENHQTYHEGDMIHLKGTFSDDQGLKSYSVYIGDENGDQSHTWHFSEEGNIDGDHFEYEGHLTVPDSLPEMLFIHFVVSDRENKTASDQIMMHFHQ